MNVIIGKFFPGLDITILQDEHKEVSKEKGSDVTAKVEGEGRVGTILFGSGQLKKNGELETASPGINFILHGTCALLP